MTGLVHTQRVRAEWVDYNGHVSEAYYVLVFGHATDALMDQVGLGQEYRDHARCSLYTVEAHVRYLHEVAGESEIEVTTSVVGVDAKRLHVCHEMRVDEDLVATEELLTVHVDQVSGRVCAMPEPVRLRLDESCVPAPRYAGRSVTLRQQGR